LGADFADEAADFAAVGFNVEVTCDEAGFVVFAILVTGLVAGAVGALFCIAQGLIGAFAAGTTLGFVLGAVETDDEGAIVDTFELKAAVLGVVGTVDAAELNVLTVLTLSKTILFGLGAVNDLIVLFPVF